MQSQCTVPVAKDMCRLNVVVMNAHLLADKVRLWGALQPSEFSFDETGSIPNAFSTILTSERHCPREIYNMGKTLTKTHQRKLREHGRQASLHHVYSASSAGNEAQVRRRRTRGELILGARLEKGKEGVVSPPGLIGDTVTVRMRWLTSSRLRTKSCGWER